MKKAEKIIALALAALMLFSFTACDGGESVTTTAPEKTTESELTEPVTEPVTEPSTEVLTEPSTEAATQAVTEIKTTEAEKTTHAAATTVPATVIETTTAAPKPVAPSTKSEIVKLYNDAVITASKTKPAYSKTVNTVLSDIDMGALSKLDVVKEAVGSFLGEGKTDSSVSKGKFDGNSLVKSTLKESDVTSATCKLSADSKYYIVEITVKNETNPLKSSSALGRFTKDYKDVNEIREGMAEAGAGVDGITVSSSSVKIKAEISVESMRFKSINHSFKMSAKLTDVKYTIIKVKNASANLSTTVAYSNFKY